MVGDAVMDGVGVGLGVMVNVAVGVGETVGVCVAVGASVGVRVAISVGKAVGVGVGVFVGVRVVVGVAEGVIADVVVAVDVMVLGSAAANAIVRVAYGVLLDTLLGNGVTTVPEVKGAFDGVVPAPNALLGKANSVFSADGCEDAGSTSNGASPPLCVVAATTSVAADCEPPRVSVAMPKRRSTAAVPSTSSPNQGLKRSIRCALNPWVTRGNWVGIGSGCREGCLATKTLSAVTSRGVNGAFTPAVMSS